LGDLRAFLAGPQVDRWPLPALVARWIGRPIVRNYRLPKAFQPDFLTGITRSRPVARRAGAENRPFWQAFLGPKRA